MHRGTARRRTTPTFRRAGRRSVFAGVVGGVKPALIGSPDGLLRAPWEAATGDDLGYYLLQYMRQDADRAATRREGWRGPSYAAAVDRMLEPGVLPASGARMEFLAKPLFHSYGVLVATPVFVAHRTSRRAPVAGS
ncbi:DUF7019 family protein [Streptomyces sp. NPDC090054]|uniref:DUF7019 family protein n=1 Tax=Streptomyces sp. NPDC090054 TaxID=3365933 RepID=UPI00381B0696